MQVTQATHPELFDALDNTYLVAPLPGAKEPYGEVQAFAACLQTFHLAKQGAQPMHCRLLGPCLHWARSKQVGEALLSF